MAHTSLGIESMGASVTSVMPEPHKRRTFLVTNRSERHSTVTFVSEELIQFFWQWSTTSSGVVPCTWKKNEASDVQPQVVSIRPLLIYLIQYYVGGLPKKEECSAENRKSINLKGRVAPIV